ncbi:hypothetical protein DDB_G0276433 [Dictyostelium discoideum AX4]|uniref:Putative uncharacterized protein DDB_G0276433 n=1 Tax=Dictyostelium discoideum TaxID=44689 RepID=Y7068_DICDI|nr:hypothetical protein DDB_G0276433 [Dictyostelium discoideum AX4]Q86HW0.1 RecName: Full=Putative uncharacterized protein DDB_G0276433 [Dictyostelium discoideum]EAL69170.1 hypothetical protein DDB_G0276433 [Dictyostelium discoideum AX4]|eukprot:XP_643132.1 hypothetical protein DDB_G0276433 [Dictyostelium discoideum AX4]
MSRRMGGGMPKINLSGAIPNNNTSTPSTPTLRSSVSVSSSNSRGLFLA